MMSSCEWCLRGKHEVFIILTCSYRFRRSLSSSKIRKNSVNFWRLNDFMKIFKFMDKMHTTAVHYLHMSPSCIEQMSQRSPYFSPYLLGSPWISTRSPTLMSSTAIDSGNPVSLNGHQECSRVLNMWRHWLMCGVISGLLVWQFVLALHGDTHETNEVHL